MKHRAGGSTGRPSTSSYVWLLEFFSIFLRSWAGTMRHFEALFDSEKLIWQWGASFTDSRDCDCGVVCSEFNVVHCALAISCSRLMSL